jgi:hypothetical protein
MRVAALLLAIAGVAFPLVVGCHVDPIQASWSGWTVHGTPTDRISEVITCNFDSLAYVELFTGFRGAGANYHLDIYEYPDGPRVAYRHDIVPGRDHTWLRFDRIRLETGRSSLTKGKQYEFRFTRGGSDGIQYYYQGGNPHPYGHMRVGSADQTDRDLCVRVYGRMNEVSSSLFGATGIMAWWARDTWPSRAGEAGVGWATRFFYWNEVEPSPDSWTWSEIDADTRSVCESVPSVVGVIMQCPSWASSRPRPDTWAYSSTFAAPRGLWSPVEADTNYFVRYLRELMYHTDGLGRPSDNIHTWEIWNEPNEGCTLYVSGNTYRGYSGFWRQPDSQFYPNDDGLDDMSALYMKLASVAAQTIRGCTLYGADHRNDRILIGSLGRVDFEKLESLRLYKGREWLEGCYQAAQDSNYGVFWDGVSVHPYHYGHFSADTLEKHSRMLREVMRQHDDYSGLWGTEFGWSRDAGNPTESQQRAARVIAETFVTTEGSKALAQGGLDHMCWWVFSETGPAFGGEPLVDSAMNRYPAFYAYKQMTHTLTGKRCNGRVMTGDNATDTLVRMYEFEDTATLKRTWVCWKDDKAEHSGVAKLPVRTNRLAAESLAYTGTPPAFSPTVASDGWLSMSLNPRPLFISEAGSPLRPDLRVDSVQFARGSRVVRAWVTNHGTRATPVRSGSRSPYPTWAVLRANGDSLAQQVRTATIAANQQAEFTFDLGQTRLPDTVLFSVTVNPSQSYVELGTDDNTGYTPAIKP